MADPGPGRVQGRVALVTGGAGGIGQASVQALAGEGASVAVVDVQGDRAQEVADAVVRTGGSAIGIAADVSDESQVAGAVARAVAEFGRLDILHNNAALTDTEFLSLDGSVTDMSLDVWDRTLSVNLTSQMLTCKHAIPDMVRTGGGSIINMSSGASLSGDRTRTAYGVSKAGVNALTLYVATGHGKQGVRVNTIVPGLILTDAVRAHLSEEMVNSLGRATLTPSVGEPGDVADLVVFLASDESRYITGQMFVIDGGMTARAGHVGGEE